MTTVNLSGTWSEKTKPNNGLTKVAELINSNRTIRVPIVGWVEFHQWTEKATGEVLTVALPVVESALDADGKDSHGWGEAVIEMIDALRKERGLSAAEDVPMHSGEMSGQIQFEFDDDGAVSGEVRLGADGEHRVPEASGEEIMAEREEAAAAGVPAASFSGGAA
jgi:hypothetical protein